MWSCRRLVPSRKPGQKTQGEENSQPRKWVEQRRPGADAAAAGEPHRGPKWCDYHSLDAMGGGDDMLRGDQGTTAYKPPSDAQVH